MNHGIQNALVAIPEFFDCLVVLMFSQHVYVVRTLRAVACFAHKHTSYKYVFVFDVQMNETDLLIYESMRAVVYALDRAVDRIS